jgi:hypothetical protein
MWALTKLASREIALSLSYPPLAPTQHNKMFLEGGFLLWVWYLDGIGEGSEFDVRGCAIGIPPCIVGGTFHGFGIGFDGGGVVSLFEEVVAFFAG